MKPNATSSSEQRVVAKQLALTCRPALLRRLLELPAGLPVLRLAPTHLLAGILLSRHLVRSCEIRGISRLRRLEIQFPHVSVLLPRFYLRHTSPRELPQTARGRQTPRRSPRERPIPVLSVPRGSRVRRQPRKRGRSALGGNGGSYDIHTPRGYRSRRWYWEGAAASGWAACLISCIPAVSDWGGVGSGPK